MLENPVATKPANGEYIENRACICQGNVLYSGSSHKRNEA